MKEEVTKTTAESSVMFLTQAVSDAAGFSKSTDTSSPVIGSILFFNLCSFMERQYKHLPALSPYQAVCLIYALIVASSPEEGIAKAANCHARQRLLRKRIRIFAPC